MKRIFVLLVLALCANFIYAQVDSSEVNTPAETKELSLRLAVGAGTDWYAWGEARVGRWGVPHYSFADLHATGVAFDAIKSQEMSINIGGGYNWYSEDYAIMAAVETPKFQFWPRWFNSAAIRLQLVASSTKADAVGRQKDLRYVMASFPLILGNGNLTITPTFLSRGTGTVETGMGSTVDFAIAVEAKLGRWEPLEEPPTFIEVFAPKSQRDSLEQLLSQINTVVEVFEDGIETEFSLQSEAILLQKTKHFKLWEFTTTDLDGAWSLTFPKDEVQAIILVQGGRFYKLEMISISEEVIEFKVQNIDDDPNGVVTFRFVAEE